MIHLDWAQGKSAYSPGLCYRFRMLAFLANNIEQLDLALEHVTKGDANNARFGLMLTDNVVEITLHQLAKDQKSKKKIFSPRDAQDAPDPELERALGQHFESKVRFAKRLGLISQDVGESISILHSFRNEVYHIGVQHEAILPTLAILYFKIACDILGTYSPRFLGWGSNQKIPERAARFFTGSSFFPGSTEQYQAACAGLARAADYVPGTIIAVLANHMAEIVEQQDTSIDMIATGGPRPSSRDEAVVESQVWPLAFSEAGRAFTQEQGWKGGSVLDHVAWVKQHYPFQFRSDPIPSWRKRVESLQRGRNPHKALKQYRDFMHQTADLRAALEESHRQLDLYIEEQIERMRGN